MITCFAAILIHHVVALPPMINKYVPNNLIGWKPTKLWINNIAVVNFVSILTVDNAAKTRNSLNL